jgi:hypothetical protein
LSPERNSRSKPSAVCNSASRNDWDAFSHVHNLRKQREEGFSHSVPSSLCALRHNDVRFRLQGLLFDASRFELGKSIATRRHGLLAQMGADRRRTALLRLGMCEGAI